MSSLVVDDLVDRIDRLDAVDAPSEILRVAEEAIAADLLGRCRAALESLAGGTGPALTAHERAEVEGLLALDRFATGRWSGLDERPPGRSSRELLARGLVEAARGSTVAEASADVLLRRAGAGGERSAAGDGHRILALSAVGSQRFGVALGHAMATAGRTQASTVLLDLVESAVRTGREEETSGPVTGGARLADATGSPRLRLVAEAAVALLGGADPLGRFRAALATTGVDAWPFDHARVRLLYGEALRAAGRPLDARLPLWAALDTFEHLRARPWSARAAHALRATGMRIDPVAAGLEQQVTAEEWRLASLAASGLTNRQIGQQLFVSHRTVAARLGGVYEKLGVTSRAGLADALERRNQRARAAAPARRGTRGSPR